MYRIVVADLEGYEQASEWIGSITVVAELVGYKLMREDFSSITIEYGGEQLDGI